MGFYYPAIIMRLSLKNIVALYIEFGYDKLYCFCRLNAYQYFLT